MEKNKSERSGEIALNIEQIFDSTTMDFILIYFQNIRKIIRTRNYQKKKLKVDELPFSLVTKKKEVDELPLE